MPREIKKDLHLLKMLSKRKGDEFKNVIGSLSDDTVDNVSERSPVAELVAHRVYNMIN